MAELKPCCYEVASGREGWVYLIHAIGTSRYKIGRSVNPVKRYETLKGQSPYPLQVVSTTFSLDAIADEDALHRYYSKYRAHGEWFEFNCSQEALFRLIDYDQYDSVANRIIQSDYIFLAQFLPESSIRLLSEKLYFLHGKVRTHADLLFVESLIREDIPAHIGLTGKSPDTPFPVNRRVVWSLRSIEDLCEDGRYLLPRLEIYIAGIIEGAIMALGRRAG